MRKLLISLLLVAATVNAQKFGKQSLEMSVGRNLYSDKLGDSRGDILVNTGYRYMLTETFGLQGFWQFDQIESKNLPNHPDCEYSAVSHAFKVEMFKRLARFGRFTVNGTAGLGTTFYFLQNDSRARVFNYTAAGNVFYSLGKKRNPWGALKLEYRGLANTDQDYTLNQRFRTTSTPIQAFKQDVSLGFVVYLDNRTNKSHADWSKVKREDKKVVNNQNVTINKSYITYPTEVINNTIISPLMKFVVFFDEGSTKIRNDQLEDIYKSVELLRGNKDLKVVLKGGACTNQGSPARNLQLSQQRAKNVYNKMNLMGIHQDRMQSFGTGHGNGYSGINQEFQKRVEIILY